MTPDEPLRDIDEKDRAILPILAEDPRKPYGDIANELAGKGYDLSGESVRRRVSKLLNLTSGFFLVAPEQTSSELILISVTVADHPNANDEVYEDMQDMDFWFVADGFGTVDIYGVATRMMGGKVKALLRSVREHEYVTDIDYHIETRRAVNMSEYLVDRSPNEG